MIRPHEPVMGVISPAASRASSLAPDRLWIGGELLGPPSGGRFAEGVRRRRVAAQMRFVARARRAEGYVPETAVAVAPGARENDGPGPWRGSSRSRGGRRG